MQNIAIWSEAFKNGENIPVEYTCDGKNISPELSWNGIPVGTKSIALIMDDPDAPMGTFVHWILFNIPADVNKLHSGIRTREPFFTSEGRQDLVGLVMEVLAHLLEFIDTISEYMLSTHY